MPKQKSLALKEFLAQSLQSGRGGGGGGCASCWLKGLWPRGESVIPLRDLECRGTEPAVVAVNDSREVMQMVS